MRSIVFIIRGEATPKLFIIHQRSDFILHYSFGNPFSFNE